MSLLDEAKAVKVSPKIKAREYVAEEAEVAVAVLNGDITKKQAVSVLPSKTGLEAQAFAVLQKGIAEGKIKVELL